MIEDQLKAKSQSGFTNMKNGVQPRDIAKRKFKETTTGDQA